MNRSKSISFYHGLIGDPSNWDDVSSEIKANIACISSESLDYFRRRICELIQRASYALATNNHSSNIVVGNSLGCVIALGVADHVDKIILTAPPYKFSYGPIPRNPDSIESYVRSLAHTDNIDSIIDSALVGAKNKLCSYLSSRENICKLRSIKKELVDSQFIELMIEHQDKIHFVLGANDIVTPVDDLTSFIKNNMQNAKIAIVPNCGHAIPIERPGELARIIKEYL